jgi:acyl carrier protein
MSIEDEVIAFVAKTTGVPAGRITPQTTLFGDLGVDGLDGYDLLVAFKERFSVDLQECRIDRHFGPESCFVPWAVLYWLLLLWRACTEKGSTSESRARMVPITVQNLVDSAKAGVWTVQYDEKK